MPRTFKKAVVNPLNKKPNVNPEVLRNYRPVSNRPYMSKILERAVADQLQTHLDASNFHVKFQFANRRDHSTEPALLQILNDGNDALLILQDLSAAFYTIEHTLLFQRLHSELCFDSTVLKWFTSYLSGRLLDISCHLRLLFFVEFRRDQCSVLSSFPFISDSWQSSFKSSALSTTFFADDSELYSCPPTERESALKAVKKKKKERKREKSGVFLSED